MYFKFTPILFIYHNYYLFICISNLLLYCLHLLNLICLVFFLNLFQLDYNFMLSLHEFYDTCAPCTLRPGFNQLFDFGTRLNPTQVSHQ